MTPDDLGKKVESLIVEASNQLNKGISASQTYTYNSIIGMLKDLDTYKDGRIKRTKANLRVIRRVSNSITNDVLTDAYIARVNSFLGSYDSIESIQTAYFKDAFKDYDFREMYDVIKTQSIESARDLLLSGGIDTNLSQPVKQILTNNLLSGSSYPKMIEEVRNFMLGNDDIDGRLLSYTKQVTSDSLHIYSGVYNEAVSHDLGLEWLKYTGSVKDTTRSFCSSRAGKFYHKTEVEDWADDKWSGKMKGTNSENIFYYVGGYHCRHILVYVSESIVPESVKARVSQ
jgi:hypothetical protein